MPCSPFRRRCCTPSAPPLGGVFSTWQPAPCAGHARVGYRRRDRPLPFFGRLSRSGCGRHRGRDACLCTALVGGPPGAQAVGGVAPHPRCIPAPGGTVLPVEFVAYGMSIFRYVYAQRMPGRHERGLTMPSHSGSGLRSPLSFSAPASRCVCCAWRRSPAWLWACGSPCETA